MLNLNFGNNHKSLDIVLKFISNNDNFAIYGVSNIAKNIANMLSVKYKKKVSCYINDTKKTIKHIDGIKVCNAKDINSSFKIIIASYDEIIISHNLYKKYNFCYGGNFIFFDHISLAQADIFKNSFGLEFANFLAKEKQKILEVFRILSDKQSKDTFYKILNFRCNLFNVEKLPIEQTPFIANVQEQYTQDMKKYTNYLSPINKDFIKKAISFKLALNPYEYLDKITIKNKKNILDLGAYFDTSVMFSYLAKKAKIFAFEPQEDIHQYNVYLSNIYKNIIPINKGVWSKDETLLLNIDKNEKTSSKISTNGTFCVKVLSIDSFSKKENIDNIDFIKMDIEGAEIQALLGARNVIKNQKPTLAISIYHKNEHLYEIPLLLKELVPEYKIFIDHKYFGATETICFATI